MPRPSPASVGAEAPLAAEQTATLQLFPTANTFPRPPLQLPDAPTRRWVNGPGDLDLLILKMVCESRLTWATSVPILVFLGLSVLGLGPMYATDVRRQTDRQTSDKSIA